MNPTLKELLILTPLLLLEREVDFESLGYATK